MLEVADLVVTRRRRRVLDGCSVIFEPGVTVLAGANGAGKSTLLRACVGLVPLTAGTVVLGGRRLGRRGLDGDQGGLVGYLPQAPMLPGSLTVAAALEYAAWLRPPRRAGLPAVVVEELGLGPWLSTSLGELSGGWRRLALLAVALAHGPQVLLLDECTTGVDVEHRRVLREVLRADDTRVVVVASHLAEDLQHLADRIAVLGGGRVAFDGSPSELAEVGAAVVRSNESVLEAALRHVAAGCA